MQTCIVGRQYMTSFGAVIKHVQEVYSTRNSMKTSKTVITTPNKEQPNMCTIISMFKPKRYLHNKIDSLILITSSTHPRGKLPSMKSHLTCLLVVGECVRYQLTRSSCSIRLMGQSCNGQDRQTFNISHYFLIVSPPEE